MPTPLTDADKVLRNDVGKRMADALEAIAEGSGGSAKIEEMTQAEYDALTPAQKADGTLRAISDGQTKIQDIDNVTITTSDNNKLLGVSVSESSISVSAVSIDAADIPYSAGVSVADKLDEVSVSYDATEKVVGVWQDGKPLYEKTIKWNGTISTGTQEINTNITNPNFVFFDTVILNDNSLNTLCFPYISTNANVNGYIKADGTKIHIDVGTYWNTHKLYFAFKLRYTKTTD